MYIISVNQFGSDDSAYLGQGEKFIDTPEGVYRAVVGFAWYLGRHNALMFETLTGAEQFLEDNLDIIQESSDFVNCDTLDFSNIRIESYVLERSYSFVQGGRNVNTKKILDAYRNTFGVEFTGDLSKYAKEDPVVIARTIPQILQELKENNS